MLSCILTRISVIIWCSVHVNVAVERLPLGSDLSEKDKHFPSLTSQGICAPEVNEV